MITTESIIEILKSHMVIQPYQSKGVIEEDCLIDVAGELQQLFNKHDVIGSGEVLPSEDDEDYDEPEQECSVCGKVEGHQSGCPEDDSPFALLERRGFD